MRMRRDRSEEDAKRYQIAKQKYEDLGQGGAGVSEGSWVGYVMDQGYATRRAPTTSAD